MTIAAWQIRIDTAFPNGAIITQVDDVPEGYDDNMTFVVPRILVMAVSSSDMPTLETYSLGTDDKGMSIIVETINDEQPHHLDVTDVSGVRWLIYPPTQEGALDMIEQSKTTNPYQWENVEHAETDVAAA